LQKSTTKPLLAAAVEHEAEPHHHVVGEPLPVDSDGTLAGDVDGVVDGGVEEDLAE
jgi:hypothetical protein